jgi:hypothetical protein
MTTDEQMLVRTYVNSFLISTPPIERYSQFFYDETVKPWVELGYDEQEVKQIADRCFDLMISEGFMDVDDNPDIPHNPNRYKVYNIQV